ncbi:hypothetical protein WDU94_005230 [Cyamophila willieti]
MGALKDGTYDLGATGALMTTYRISMAYFLVDTFEMKTAIIFRQPRLVSVSNIYFKAFSSQVWLCIAACLLLGSIILHIQVSVLRGIQMEKSNSHETFADRVTFVWAALCQQGNHIKAATSDSVRISMFTILLTALFLFYPYSANITALLQSPGGAIRTVDDIVTSPIKILVHDMPYSIHMIAENNKSAVRKVYQEKIFSNQGEHCGVYVNIEKGIERVRTGMYGFQVRELVEGCPLKNRLAKTLNPGHHSVLYEPNCKVRCSVQKFKV